MMGITLYEPAPIPDDEPRREEAVEASGALALRRDPALQALLADLRRSFRVPMAAISILYRDWQYLIAADGLPDGPTSRRTSFCGHAIARPTEILYVPDASLDPRFAGNPVVSEEGGVRFYAAATLAGEDRQPLGAVCVFDDHARDTLTVAERDRLKAAAERAMAIIAKHGGGAVLRAAAG